MPKVISIPVALSAGSAMIGARCCLAGLAFLGLAVSPAVSAERAVAFSTGSYVDTAFPLSKIKHKEHSISFRLNLQYPNTTLATLIGVTGSGPGFYKISKSDTPSGSTEKPGLNIRIGNAEAMYTPTAFGPTSSGIIKPLETGFARGKWYHVTVTVDASLNMRLYIDGNLLPNFSGSVIALSNGDEWGSGNLRFGRSALADLEQFYGLLKDVGVWKHALSQTEITKIAKQKLKGNETGLHASWDFASPNIGSSDGPSAFWSPKGGAQSVTDDKPLAPLLTTKLTLPFKGPWRVTQGADSDHNSPARSHRSYASFCLDLVNDAAATEGEHIYAVADGNIVIARDSTPDQPNQVVPGCTECVAGDGSCAYISNEVFIEHAAGEYSQYIHFMKGSIPTSVKNKVKSGAIVKRGELIGRAGQSGNASGPHLHFCMGWGAAFVPGPVNASGKDELPTPPACGYTPAVAPGTGVNGTRPFAFTNYVVGNSTLSGTPQLDQIVRRPIAIKIPGALPPSAKLAGAFIRNKHSGRCAQVAGASNANSAGITQWDCVQQDNVKWTVVDAGGGFFFIKAKHSNKCMQVADASTANGGVVTQWDCVAQDNVKWEFLHRGKGIYNIKARHSEKCLQVAGSSSSNGAKLSQADCKEQDNMKWQFE